LENDEAVVTLLRPIIFSRLGSRTVGKEIRGKRSNTGGGMKKRELISLLEPTGHLITKKQN